MAKSKKISKDDLRRLMKEKKATIKSTEKRIDHPLAKYNSLDQLVCTLCNVQVKSALLWTAHLQGRTHRETLALMKSKERDKQNFITPQVPPSKRKRADGEAGTEKKMKLPGQENNVSGLPADFFSASLTPATSSGGVNKHSSLDLAGYDSDSPDEEEKVVSMDTVPAGLPTNFFDSSVKPSETEAAEPAKVVPMADALPEGFFDDAKMDAKVRKVEYKDKMDEEWEMFQRAMKEQNTVSEAIVAEEDEDVAADREITEIDEQLHCWTRVNQLERKKQEIMSHESETGQKDKDNESDIEEDDFDEFLDWRSKKVWH